MANTSIQAAFQQFWAHVVNALNTKANTDDITNLQTQIEEIDALPQVSTSDNGKFLRVTDGSWGAVTVPSAEEASF